MPRKNELIRAGHGDAWFAAKGIGWSKVRLAVEEAIPPRTAPRFYNLVVLENDDGTYVLRLTYGWLVNRDHPERNHEIVKYQGPDAAAAIKLCNQMAAPKLRNGYRHG